MPSTPLAPGSLPDAAAFVLAVPKALGQRPVLDEEAATGPPPAAVDRARTVFEATGLILVFLIAFAAVWILIRRRL